MVNQPDHTDRDAAMRVEFLRERDVPCPSCGYNLRGCAEGKCPECGRDIVLGVGGNFAVGPAMWAAAGLWLAGLGAIDWLIAIALLMWPLGRGMPDTWREWLRWMIVPAIIAASFIVGGVFAARFVGRCWRESEHRPAAQKTIVVCWVLSVAVNILWFVWMAR